MEEFNKKEYLEDVLYSYAMPHVKDQTDAYKAAAERLMGAVEKHYGDKVIKTFKSGSIAKRTSVNIKFDIDFVIAFRRDSFGTLQEMSDDVFKFLDNYRKENDDIIDSYVKKQKVSIGFTYRYFDNGVQKEIPIDVVPGRELRQDDYEETGNLNLFFRESTWGFMSDEGSSQKTNIEAQADKICGKNDERKVIRLLKVWKKCTGKHVKSFVLELFTLKAMVARMDSADRTTLKSEMDNMLRQIETWPEYIKIAFPENREHKRKKESYGVRTGMQVPLPPTGKRFG